MELKAELKQPYTEEERINFIFTQNHQLGYEIRFVEDGLEAWGETTQEIFEQAKTAKIEENTLKAKQAEESGYITFKDAQFETNTATANNLDKKREFCILRGETSAIWLSKDDKQVELFINEEEPLNDDFVKIGFAVEGFKENLWNTKYLGYINQINEATTIEELNAIVIDYTTNEEEENVL